MTDFLLHSRTNSPYGSLIRRALGIGGTSWQAVENVKNENLRHLFRCGPVLQQGRELYMGADLACMAIEHLRRGPSLFPNGNQGMPRALGVWAERQLRAAVEYVVGQIGLEPFRELCPDVLGVTEVETVKPAGSAGQQALEILHGGLGLVADQMADGRPFLQGEAPGLADLQAALAPAFAIKLLGDTHQVFDGFPMCLSWERRLAKFESVGQENHACISLTESRAKESAKPEADYGSSVLAEIGSSVLMKSRLSGKVVIEGAFLGAAPDRFVVQVNFDGHAHNVHLARPDHLLVRS